MKNDLATKADIQNAIEVSEKRLRDEIASVRTDLQHDIADVAAEVRRLSQETRLDVLERKME
jgi:prefoldin subunit 5